MRKLLLLLFMIGVPASVSYAQKAVVEETVVDVECKSATHAVTRFREVVTILNAQGASLASFVCSCGGRDKLTHFKGTVADGSGRVIKKIKEGELQKTEYSPYLAVDEYKVYLDYMPPVYPVTVTYEWTIESRDNLVGFPPFMPQTSYDISVKKASYRLKAPSSMNVRYALQHIKDEVKVENAADGSQLFTLDVCNLPMLRAEAYARPFHERVPMAWFAPTDFVYYGTNGSLYDWDNYGQWQYGLIKDLDVLPDEVRAKLHQLTDTLETDREKVETIYGLLGQTTRYVAVLLGIGGLQPAAASSVSKSGYGDCKGLSNYMRAMLKEVGIPSHYMTISTVNRHLRKDFASIGQMNHVILQVPLPDDTIWLECTNPQLPMGYLHHDIAGHDAIEISEHGGRLVQLPTYPDSANVMRSKINISLSADGAANMTITQQNCCSRYEQYIPMQGMNREERQKAVQQLVYMPQAEIDKVDLHGVGAEMTLSVEAISHKYASQTGRRLFVPLCPLHRGYGIPNGADERQEDILLRNGYCDLDEITLSIPEGYTIESRPEDVRIELPFASFTSSLCSDGKTIQVKNRLQMKSGTYDKSLYPQFVEFLRTINSAYGKAVVLKQIN